MRVGVRTRRASMVRRATKGLGSLLATQPRQTRPLPRSDGRSSGDASKFYSSKEWRDIRAAIKKRDGNRCTRCGVDVSSSGAARVDHIQPLKLRWDLRLAPSNLRTLCVACDNVVGGRTFLQPVLGQGCNALGLPLDPSHPWNSAP